MMHGTTNIKLRVQVLVTEQYETIQLNLILVQPAGCFELDCAGLMSDIMSRFYEHGDNS